MVTPQLIEFINYLFGSADMGFHRDCRLFMDGARDTSSGTNSGNSNPSNVPNLAGANHVTIPSPLSGEGIQNREDSTQISRFIKARVPAPLVVKTVFAMAVVEMKYTGPTPPPARR